MKKIFFCCMIAVATLTNVAFANTKAPLQISLESSNNQNHKINGFKYFCMEYLGNQYDLEDKFNAFFASIGFVIISEDEVEELDENERQYILYGSYVCQLVMGGSSNLTLTLRNQNGKMIFSSSKEGTCFFSPKCEFNKASDKIIMQLKKLNYKFDSNLVGRSNQNNSIN